jgi:hypothetical protein
MFKVESRDPQGEWIPHLVTEYFQQAKAKRDEIRETGKDTRLSEWTGQEWSIMTFKELNDPAEYTKHCFYPRQ